MVVAVALSENPGMLAHVLRHGGPVISIIPSNEQAVPGRHVQAITIRSGDLTSTVHDIYPPEDMPVLKPIEAASGGALDGAEFLRALRTASISVSDEETRYYLNGVMIEAHEGAMRMVSTNGHRLTVIDLPSLKWDCPKQVIVPRKAISLMRNLFKPGKSVIIQMNETGLTGVARQDGVSLQFKAIDGTFPNYNRVIPTVPDPAPFDLTISGDALAMIYVPPHGSHALALDPLNGTMTLRCPDSMTSAVPLSGRGPEGKAIGFNILYLRDFCPPGEAIRLRAMDTGSAARIVGADPNVLMILMPMRV